ncbi:putative bifunctional diguanylate cyclase/phosphodiesterase [Blastococcus sp. PRF04-17]|uniref:putative bifunctional diguanylate cyclase/phosphodiesterase n=1 Tax=Blastococcus sp. PRF04-17 TaxID=2933797 RepID=UPI001FF5EFF6|nr:bifunctional diguanylate cyclase/phosphodiesterase [Blastococcus sp. PRF04-17]UOY03503.1 bifunctional diguanylate cyclase/phosphodiesterase [Blastococcus sp. PRF04-17]
MTAVADTGLPAGARTFRVGPAQRIMLLTATVAAAAVALFVLVVRPLPEAATAVALPWFLWAAAFALCEALVVHVQWQREAHSFSVGDLVLGAGLILAAPQDLVIAQVVGAGATLLLHRRQRGIKLAFNVALYGVGGSLATGVFALLSGPAFGTWDWLAALLAILVSTVVADLCIFAVISLSEGRPTLAPLLEMLALSLPFTLGSAAVGLVLARSAATDPAALALLALPSVLIVAAYRAYTGAREQQENLRLLHEVTSLLHSSGDSQEALGDFLHSVRSAFRAELAELVLLGPAGRDGATVSRSREGEEAVVMAPLEDAQDQHRLLRLASASGTLATRTGTGRGQPLGEYAAGRGLKDAMAAALRTDDRVHGLLLVGGRLGDVTTFSSSDLALLDTFARHVATSLERGRLEENLRQVTDLKEQLRHQALHDPLTGLPNRTLFLDRVRHAVDTAGRTRVWPAVLYLDLDGFKPVNDTFGHEAGDVLLRTVADRLRGCLRPADTAARLGGDEFVVLLNGPIDRFGVARVVDRIRAQLDVPILLGDGVVTTVGASIGVGIGDAGVPDADTLVRHADIAMYAAKRSLGQDFLIYEPGLGTTTSSNRKDSAAELAAAIENGELRTVYQPLIDMRTGRPIGAEALVRWQHPTEGMRSPDQFISLAEESGLITQIGELVLGDACHQAARWVEASPDQEDLLVTVNLSARQVGDEQIVEQVRDALAQSGLEPRRLVLEITETVLMHDRDAAAATLWLLKGLGVRIAIDDFGTGYSSLAYLRRFPIDMLKVAREFVDGLGRDAHDDVITRAIVELAGTLGLLTVAEGIETTQQSETVAALGCDIAQGYLFSRPIEADAASEVMSASVVSPIIRPRPQLRSDQDGTPELASA